MPTANAKVKPVQLHVELIFNRETKNTVRYDVADDATFPDINSLYIRKEAFRQFHADTGEFPKTVTLDVTAG